MVCLVLVLCLLRLSTAFWGGVKKVGWGVSKPNRAASYTARVRSGQVAGVGAGPESHGRGVDGFVRVAVEGDVTSVIILWFILYS
jgi:hypothetical protein